MENKDYKKQLDVNGFINKIQNGHFGPGWITYQEPNSTCLLGASFFTRAKNLATNVTNDYD